MKTVAAGLIAIPLLLGPAAQAQTQDHIDAVKKAQKSAYAIGASTNNCPTSDADLLGWPAHLLRYCEYKQAGLPGVVYLLTIAPERIAQWIETSCARRMPGESGCFRVDLGSGGGFPGVVLACAMAEAPGAVVHLVERNARKAAFLREALRITEAAGKVHLADIGDCVDSFSDPVDCVTARAVAPLHQLLGFAEPLVGKGAMALFLKGQDVEAELTEAAKYWNVTPRLHPSLTGQGWIVELDRLERAPRPATTQSSRA